MGKDKSNSGRKAEKEKKKEQRRGQEDNERNAPVRVGQFGGNWQSLPVNQFAKSNGLKINFAGFWDRSDNGKKVEGEDPTSGYKFIMDSTEVYYRVQNAAGQYVDAGGRTIADPAYAGDQNAFNAASHFTNSAPK